MVEFGPIATPATRGEALGVCLPRAKGRPKCEAVRSMAACFLSKLSIGSSQDSGGGSHGAFCFRRTDRHHSVRCHLGQRCPGAAATTTTDDGANRPSGRWDGRGTRLGDYSGSITDVVIAVESASRGRTNPTLSDRFGLGATRFRLAGSLAARCRFRRAD